MGSLGTGYKVRLLFLSVLTALCYAWPVPSQAASALEPFNLTARYDLAWNGIAVGRLVVVAHETPTGYDMMVDSKSRGLAAIISKEKTVTRTQGAKNAAGEHLIAHYEFRPLGKDANDYITLDYDAAGKIVKRVRTKDDDPRWRPAVPHAQINTAYDPLTAIFVLRNRLHEAVAINHHEVSARTYDGMRLFEIKLVRLGEATIDVMGEPMQTIEVALRRTPIDGYTPKELKKYQKGDPEIRFYFSDDATLIPVRATADTGFGDLTLTLDERH